MTMKEFVKRYSLEPTHACERDIISSILQGCIFVHSDGHSSNEFGGAIFPPMGQQWPDDATLGKAVSGGLKLHMVRDDGTFIYLFDPSNEKQARTAIELTMLDRCGPDRELPIIGSCRDC